MTFQLKTAALFLIVLATTSTTHAALLLHEPFDYSTGFIDGKGGNELGFDAGSTWSAPPAAIGTADVLSGSLPFGSLETSGNRFRHIRFGMVINGRATRGLNITKTSGTLWTSHLTRFVLARHLASGVFIREGATDEFGSRNKVTGINPPGNARIIYNGSEAAAGGSNLATATTYMFVTKFTNLGTTGSQAKLWILESAQYDQIAPGSAGEGQLNALVPANRQVTLNLAGTAPTLTGTELLALWVNDDFNAVGNQEFDELRIGESAFNVLNIVAPEPSTGLLLSFGLFGLVMRRRFRI